MPTGYTADIKDGISFETYAMNCARAFGACVTLRDERGGGDVIPEVFEPSDYHSKKKLEAHYRLKEISAMTEKQADAAAAEWHRQKEADRIEGLDRCRRQRQAYDAMLEKVDAWTPPTEDHASYHKFLRDQITESIKFDCVEEYYSGPIPPTTGAEWRESEINRLTRDILYHGKHHEEEVKRATERTAWVKALRESLSREA